MNEMSLEEQIRCMQDMRYKLEVFCETMRRYMDGFLEDIRYLRSYGFPIEKENDYKKGYYDPAKNDVDHVIDNVYRKHFDYIDRVIDYLERALHEQ